jgi:hypothetical protein
VYNKKFRKEEDEEVDPDPRATHPQPALLPVLPNSIPP